MRLARALRIDSDTWCRIHFGSFFWLYSLAVLAIAYVPGI